MFNPIPHKIQLETADSEIMEKAIVSDDGFNFHEVTRSACTPLPPCENFSLSKMLKAGVNLDEVSTIIRDPRDFSGIGEQLSNLENSTSSSEVTENEE